MVSGAAARVIVIIVVGLSLSTVFRSLLLELTVISLVMGRHLSWYAPEGFSTSGLYGLTVLRSVLRLL